MTTDGPQRSQEMAKLDLKDRRRATEIWSIDLNLADHPDRLAQKIEHEMQDEAFFQALMRLPEEPASLVQLLVESNDGTVSRGNVKFLAGRKASNKAIGDAFRELLIMGLVYERRSLSNLSSPNSRYLLYPDAKERLAGISVIPGDYFKRRRMKSLFAEYEWPEVFTEADRRAIFLGDGLLTVSDRSDTDDALIYRVGTGLSLVRKIDGESLSQRNVEPPEPEVRTSFGVRFYVLMQRLWVLCARSSLTFLKSETLRRSDLEALASASDLSTDEVERALQILLRLEWVRREHDRLLPTQSLSRMLQQTLDRQIEACLAHGLRMPEVADSLPRMKNRPIAEPDLALAIDPGEESHADDLESLCLLGILDRFQLDNISLYTSGQLFQLTGGETRDKHASMMLAGDFSFTMDPALLDPVSEYVLRLWTQCETKDHLLKGSITRRSIQDALFAGHAIEEFRTLLKALAGEIPPTMQTLLDDWSSRLRVIRARRMWVLDGDPEVLFHVYHSQALNAENPKLIGEEIIILDHAPTGAGSRLAADDIYLSQELEGDD